MPSSDHAQQHLPALDGIRGLAIAYVMLLHFFQAIPRPEEGVDLFVFEVVKLGWSGVDLFFVLSGFLITRILLREKGKRHYFRNFYGRRLLRIFPLYLSVLFVVFVIFPRIPHPLFQDYVADSKGDQIWFWTFLTNLRIAWRGVWYDHLIPNVLWSLAVEEQFYLVWPLVVLALRRRALVFLSAALFALPLAVRIGFHLKGVPYPVDFVFTFSRIDGIAVGSFLAAIWRKDGGLHYAAPWARGVACAALAGVAALFAWDWHGLVQTLEVTAFGLLYGSLLVLAVTVPRRHLLRRLLTTGILTTLGKYSYALYLVHGPCGTVIKKLYPPAEAPRFLGSILPATLLFAAIAGTISLVCAWCSWHVLEKRFLALKTYFRNE